MKRLTIAVLLATSSNIYASGIDVHAHANVAYASATAAQLISAMDRKGIDTIFLMSTPEGLNGEAAYNSEDILNFFPSSTYGARVKVLYGGAELNPLLHGIGRQSAISSSQRWDAEGHSEAVFPNGCSSGSGSCSTEHGTAISTAQAIEAEGSSGTNYNEFIRLAREAASSGQYVGFGEIGALHYSQRSDHPYIRFTANHAWMKELSDIAANANMIIDLHFEVSDTNKSELEDLLAHNRGTKILLEHAGWSTYGTATASLLSSLMSANSNLYLVLKKCHDDGEDACYLDSSNNIRSEWLSLISTYSQRIMIGSDAKYWNSSTSISDTMNMALRDRTSIGDRQGELKLLLDQLRVISSTLADDLTINTARAVFSLP